MKIKKHHLEILKTEINKTLDKHGRDNLIKEYENGQFSNSEKVKDLQRRFCFDLLYGSGLTKFVCDDLYPYINNVHIYTALKSICPKIERRY